MSYKKFSRRSFMKTSAAALAAGLPLMSAASPQSKSNDGSLPNIVFILADDLGWADLSIYGRRDYRTSAIDHLAKEGVRLTQAYSNSSICTPTRVAFFTGRYQQRLPVGLKEPLDWARGAPPEGFPGIPAEHPTIASLLKQGGYDTALIGKWHAGYLPKYSPNKSGFDDFFGIFSGGVDYFTHKDGYGDPDLWEDETPVEKTGYITDLITDRAVEYLRKKASKRRRFYLSVHYTAPHWPWEGPDDQAVSENLSNLFHLDGGSRKVYGHIVKRLDDGVGKLLRTLSDTGLADNTIVVFTSDNGGERFSDVWPFTGSKGGVYEGSNRVPAIIRWPGHLPAGRVSHQVAATFDWTASLLTAAKVSPHADYPLDGIDLLPYLKTAGRDEKVVPRQLYWRIGGQHAVRDGDLKYIKVSRLDQVVTQGGLPAALLGKEFLFDLKKDVRERANIIAHHPEDAARLSNAWDAWNSTVLPEPAPAA